MLTLRNVHAARLFALSLALLPAVALADAPLQGFPLQNLATAEIYGCLTANPGDAALPLGGGARMEACDDGAVGEQFWQATPVGEGRFMLSTLDFPNFCLAGGAQDDAAAPVPNGIAYLAHCNADAPDQLWQTSLVADQGFVLMNAAAGPDLCLYGDGIAADATLGGGALLDSCDRLPGHIWFATLTKLVDGVPTEVDSLDDAD